MKTFINVQCLCLKKHLSRCNHENTQKIKKTNKKGIFKCIEFIFCDITMIVYSIALSRYLTTTEQILFCGFQALTESNWGSKSIANFYGAENKKIIADGSRENYIDVLSMELACIQELGIMCFFQKHTFFILSTKTVGFRDKTQL